MRFAARIVCFSVLCTGLFIAQCSPTSTTNTPPSGTTELEGRWAGTMSFGGNVTMMFSGGSFSSSGDYISIGTFSVVTSTNPKQINLNLVQIPTAPQYAGMITLGVYSLSGNTLLMAMAEPGTGARGAFGTASSNVFSLTKQ